MYWTLKITIAIKHENSQMAETAQLECNRNNT